MRSGVDIGLRMRRKARNIIFTCQIDEFKLCFHSYKIARVWKSETMEEDVVKSSGTSVDTDRHVVCAKETKGNSKSKPI